MHFTGLLFWIDFYAYWHTLIFILVWEMKKKVLKSFGGSHWTLIGIRILFFFQVLHEYFLSELTLISVGIPLVYTGAAPPHRHTAAASASSAARAAIKAETATRSTSAALGAGTVALDPPRSRYRLDGCLHPGDHALNPLSGCADRLVTSRVVQFAHQGGRHISIGCVGEVHRITA